MQFYNQLVSLLLICLSLSAVATPNTAADSTLIVRLQDGALSANVDNQPVARVVAALNRLSPDGCALSGYVFDHLQTTVTTRFQSLPLRKGIHRLFRGYDYLLTCDVSYMHGIHLKLLGKGVSLQPLEQNTRPAANAAEVLERLQTLFEREDIDELAVALEAAIDHPDQRVNDEAQRMLYLLEAASDADLLDDL